MNLSLCLALGLSKFEQRLFERFADSFGVMAHNLWAE